MQTDEELLRLAAKAAGLHLKAQKVNTDDKFIGFIVGQKNTSERMFWNPLTDDGDCFRLIVDLKLKVNICSKSVSIDEGTGWPKRFTYGNCPRASVRRAVVTMAADIGAKL